MNTAALLQDLFAYCLQVALLVAAGSLLPAMCRLSTATARYVYWRGLLLLCLTLPAFSLWQMTGLGTDPTNTAAIVHFGQEFVESARSLPFSGVALLLAVAGAALRFLWLGAGYWKLVRLRRRSQALHSLPDYLNEIRIRTAADAAVSLSERTAGPVAFGMRHPAIVLPATFFELSRETQRAILCHELLHVRRNDWLAAVFEQVVVSVLWFHPAVWWLVSQLQLSREQAVDRQAVQLLCQQEVYLEALVETARVQLRLAADPALLFLKKHHLRRRVGSILKEVSMSRSHLITSLAVSCGVLLVVAGIAIWTFPMQAVSLLPGFTAVKPVAVTTPSEMPDSRMIAAASQRQKQRGDQAYSVAELDEPPRLIYKEEPQYTEQAKNAKYQGTVILALEIDNQGAPRSIQVKQSLDQGLDNNAVAAVQRWKFRPGMKNGVPVSVKATIEINFRLN